MKLKVIQIPTGSDRAANTAAADPEFCFNLSLILRSGRKIGRCGVNALLRVSTRPGYNQQEGKHNAMIRFRSSIIASPDVASLLVRSAPGKELRTRKRSLKMPSICAS